MDSLTEKGIYQVYGTHPVYGKDVLLYIRKTSNQTFGKRLRQTVPHHDLYNVHILKWGLYNQLMPEVSGLRWTNILDNMPIYKVYGEHE